MSIRPLSLIAPYHLVWSRDPALDAPPEPADDEKDAGIKDGWARWQTKIAEAHRTGNWQTLVKPGQQPTLFRVRQVPTSVASKLLAVARSGDLDPVFELPALSFRVALDGIEQWEAGVPDPKIEKATDQAHPKMGRIATEAVLDLLPLALVVELGTAIFNRATNFDPLS